MAKPSAMETTVVIAGIFLLISAVFGFLIFRAYQNQRSITKKIEAAKKKKKTLKTQIEDKNVVGIDQELEKAEQMVGRFKKILPDWKKEEEDNLIQIISRLRQKSRLKLQGGYQRIDEKKSKTKVKDVTRLRYKIALEGSFRRFLYFLHQLERLEKFIKVDSFTITPGTGGPRGMWERSKRIEITVSSYYYSPQSPDDKKKKS